MSGYREVIGTSGAFDPAIDIVVCIPSFRRPHHLRLTLDSLVQQRTARPFAVVVVENDSEKRESVPVVAEYLASKKLNGICLIETRQGNCQAINAAFEAALERFPAATKLLMIDDDEIASADWIERMANCAETTGADVVGGPVLPRFEDPTKQNLRFHPAFCPAYTTSGPVSVIYGCGNCLITRPVFARLADPTFDIRFNFLGGGDTDFFMRCRKVGMKFHWAADAVITETVPVSRTNMGWITLRGLRIGAINYHVELKAARTTWSRLRLLAKMAALLPLSLFRAGRMVFTEENAIAALHPMTVAVGSALAVVGIEPQPYKASKVT